MIDCYREKIILIRCCLATQAEKLRDYLSLGKTIEFELLDLGVNNVILKTLMRYDNCSEDNCLTEVQANTLLEKLLYFCKQQCGYTGINLTTKVETIPESETLGGRIVS